MTSPGRLEYQRLSSRIFASAQDRAVIALTGAEQGVGVTEIVVGLGRFLAGHTGGPVVLVDADFRTPSLSGLLGGGGSTGLADVLRIAADPLDAVRKTVAQDLYLLPAGTDGGSPFAAPGPEALLRCFRSLRKQYRFVLVDTPPVGRSLDACAVLAGVDGVGLVVRARHTRREAVDEAISSLSAVKANLLGMILSRRPPIPGGIAR